MKPCFDWLHANNLAERVGVEPTVRVSVQQISSLPHSATLAPLLKSIFSITSNAAHCRLPHYSAHPWAPPSGPSRYAGCSNSLPANLSATRLCVPDKVYLLHPCSRLAPLLKSIFSITSNAAHCRLPHYSAHPWAPPSGPSRYAGCSNSLPANLSATRLCVPDKVYLLHPCSRLAPLLKSIFSITSNAVHRYTTDCGPVVIWCHYCNN